MVAKIHHLDNRIVYGARCVWWDSINKIATRGESRIPCCPHCRNVLFEVDNEGQWFAGIDKYEAAGHPGYRKMMEWARGKCFPDMGALEQAYKASGDQDV